MDYRKAMIEEVRNRYPAGTRILLLRMGQDPHPVPDGTMGTVLRVDDLGTVHCRFDDGRQLGLLPQEDMFREHVPGKDETWHRSE